MIQRAPFAHAALTGWKSLVLNTIAKFRKLPPDLCIPEMGGHGYRPHVGMMLAGLFTA